MQELVFLPGGGVEWLDGPDAELFPAGVEIHPRAAGVSTGTEVGGLRGMKTRTSGNYKPGYSVAGEVVRCGDEAAAKGGFAPGQRVAAYGAPYTYHKTQIVAPWTLVHRIPDSLSDAEACFAGPGAIAMHALRRGRFVAGERVVLLGMGILGQLADQMLRAWGCRTLAVDIRAEPLALAARLGCANTFNSSDGGLPAAAAAFAPGGVDGVVLFTHTDGAIMDEAADLCRDRGRLVLVGGGERIDVAWAKVFRKELDVLVSRAGGPGRYDAQYEREGQDIPPAWVRWTEGRNVAEFLEMVRAGQIRMNDLITHRVPRTEAAQVYAMLDAAPGATMGVVFEF